MLVATRAILLPLDALRMRALVLRGEVVAILTFVAGEDDFFSRHMLSFPVLSELATGIEPVTSPLPRVCSTN
jgi:hypothetical protein